MDKNKNLTQNEAFALAVQNHKENNLQVAEDLYKEILKTNSNLISANINLGILFQTRGEHQKAIPFYEKVIEIDPDNVHAHNDLGIIFQFLGQYQKALDCYEKIIEINPEHIHSHYNSGIIFYILGKHQKAINCYEKATKINPNYTEAHNSLGIVFQLLGELQKALSSYEKVIEINPNYAGAHNNLGIVFQDIGEFQKALSCYEKALEIDPNLIGALENITNTYMRQSSNFDKTINASIKSLKIKNKKTKFIDQSIPFFKLKHDVEQAKYLNSKNYKIEGIDQFQKVGAEILHRKENKEDKNNPNRKIILNKEETDILLPFYKSDYVYRPKSITGSCINPNKNWQEVEDEYLNSLKQIIYIDDFLSDEALIELREFCLVSKVWNKLYPNKYLGAFSESGFASPVHLQIATDLQQKLPKLFGPHPLTKCWGFKYDTTLGSGINIHADYAIHNLNFWITPDEYNNNKNLGGLKVYDVPAPANWTFKDYQEKADKIYQFLRDSGANCVNVPYKFNRAVLFNSAYFHETDIIDFKDEYEGRRINNTYLFGSRMIKKTK